jgi:hypothetical protein
LSRRDPWPVTYCTYSVDTFCFVVNLADDRARYHWKILKPKIMRQKI